MMKVLLDSKNKLEHIAISEIIIEDSFFMNSEIVSVDTNLKDCAPNTLYKLLSEAKRKSFDLYCKKDKKDLDAVSFGFSSGFYELSLARSGAMYTCVCSFFNGSDFSFGVSSSIELPKKVLDLFERGMSEEQIIEKLMVVDGIKIQDNNDIIRLLTNNKHNKKEYAKQSIKAAVSQMK